MTGRLRNISRERLDDYWAGEDEKSRGCTGGFECMRIEENASPSPDRARRKAWKSQFRTPAEQLKVNLHPPSRTLAPDKWGLSLHSNDCNKAPFAMQTQHLTISA